MQMESSDVPTREVLKDAIMDLEEPIVFHKLLQDDSGAYTWKLFDWDLLQLAKRFGNLKLPFRVGYNARSVNPQWEIQCPIKIMTLSEFIQEVNSSTDHKQWYYFDYKYMADWLKEKPDILSSLNWNRFGFDKAGFDSTLWIGSKGAHTNCHQDSYGCNLIAQVHGRKQWLLFSPHSTNYLQPIRIPYEESTVYSKFNMFSPTKRDEEAILKLTEKPTLITLEQGDVLFIPKGWWHYVECLDSSISVNVWLPIETDNESRLKEALTKLIIAGVGKEDNIASVDTPSAYPDYIDLVKESIMECKKDEGTNMSHSKKKLKHSRWTATDLTAKYPNYVKLLPRLEKTELMEYLSKNRERFPLNNDELLHSSISESVNVLSSSKETSEIIINALCHPDVIDKVAKLLLHTDIVI